MGLWFAPIEEIIHLDGCFAEVGGMRHTEADQIMKRGVRMGIGTNRHAPATVRTDLGPVGETLFGVDFPAQGVIRIGGALTGGDGVGGADLHTFLAVIAKINDGGVKRWAGLLPAARLW